jgi:hypothetical protein
MPMVPLARQGQDIRHENLPWNDSAFDYSQLGAFAPS